MKEEKIYKGDHPETYWMIVYICKGMKIIRIEKCMYVCIYMLFVSIDWKEIDVENGIYGEGG